MMPRLSKAYILIDNWMLCATSSRDFKQMLGYG